MDEFEKRVIDAKDELKKCQEQNKLNGCFECEQIFTCHIRKKYVDCVYKSMSKDKTGNFNF